jgi:hypothetical protein
MCNRTTLKIFIAPRRQERKECHFDPFDKAQDKLREKSFLDPSHPFGMTGRSPSPLRLGVFAGDIPRLTGARSAPYENLRDLRGKKSVPPWRALRPFDVAQDMLCARYLFPGSVVL